MKPLLPVGLLMVLAFVMAGCVEDGPSKDLANEAPEIVIEEGLRLEAFNCYQGGGNSVYEMTPGETRIGPWLARDQNPEVGDPVIGAYGRPVTGPSNGIWHVATLCESYVYKGQEYQNFGMGWIAQLIEPPEDIPTATTPRLDFFVADLSFTESAFVDLTREKAMGAEISQGQEYIVEWMTPAVQNYMHVVLTEANHGTFDFTSEIHKEFGPKEDEHIRFWQLAPLAAESHGHGEEGGLPIPAERAGGEDAMMYRPIYFDVYHTQRDGPTMKLAGESAGTFTHFPDGHVGNPLGHYWDGFDMVIELGPVPEGPLYDTTWLH